jgi:hypothetical protein
MDLLLLLMVEENLLQNSVGILVVDVERLYSVEHQQFVEILGEMIFVLMY